MTLGCSRPVSSHPASRWNARFGRAHAATEVESLEDIVDEYLPGPALDAAEEEAYFGERSVDLAAALARASRSLLADGSLHPHQRRIGHEIVSTLPRALIGRGTLLAGCVTFDDLLRAVADGIGTIHRIGELAVYDVAHRIGCYLGLSPDRVWLHCGTRAGARALGLPWRQPWLDLAELPPALRRLTSAQAEDFLCIYKGRLRPQWARVA